MRLCSFSYCVIQLRNLSSKLICLGIKTNIDNSIGTCLNFCRYEDKDLYCVVLVGQYGFRSYQGSSNSMQGLLGLNKVKTFCISDLIFFSKLKKYIYLKISREEGCPPPPLVFVRLHEGEEAPLHYLLTIEHYTSSFGFFCQSSSQTNRIVLHLYLVLCFKDQYCVLSSPAFALLPIYIHDSNTGMGVQLEL